MARDSIFQIITISAILLGPILALWAQRILDGLREKQKRKTAIFRDLLTSRATPISVQHVQALNMIELEFYPRKRKKNTRVIDAWRTYAEHLNHTASQDQAQVIAWDNRRQELLNDLLYEMAQSLKYDFEKVMIKRDSYYPRGLTRMENEQDALRQAALKVFTGESPLPVRVWEPPAQPPPAAPPPAANQ